MEIVEDIIGNILVQVIKSDRATLKEAEEFKIIINDKLSDGYKYIIIDITECEFIDSTFLGVMVNTLKALTRKGGALKLVGFKPAVKAMFELTRMNKVFDSFIDLKDAIKSLQ